MTKPRLTPWLAVSLIVSAAAFVAGAGSLDGADGIPFRFDPMMSSAIAGGLCIVWGVIWIRALILYRWRGLWLLVVSPGVLFGIGSLWMWNYAISRLH